MAFRALVGALAAVGCVFGGSPAAVAGRGGAPAAPALRSLGVKVLAQRREPELRRLLASLDAADYPDAADISVEIFVDGLPRTSWFGRNRGLGRWLTGGKE